MQHDQTYAGGPTGHPSEQGDAQETATTFKGRSPQPVGVSKALRWRNVDQPRIAGMATFEWDVLNGTTWYSPEWEAMTGTSDYDWTQPNKDGWWEKHVHPEDLVDIERICIALMSGIVEACSHTYRFKRTDGIWRWFLNRCQVIEKAPDGSPLLVSGVCIDATDILSDARKTRGESSITDIAYHSMLENSPDLFVRFDRNHLPIYANPVIRSYLGRSKKGLADTHDVLCAGGNYKEVLERNLCRVFAERAVTHESLWVTLADGRQIYGECSFWPESDEEGVVRYAMVQFRDITEKHRARKEAALNERRLEALYRLTLMTDAPEAEVLNFVMDSTLSLTDSRSGFLFIPDEPGKDTGYLLWSEDHYACIDRCLLPSDHLPADLIVQLTGADGKRGFRMINNSDSEIPLYVVFDGKMSIFRGIIASATENGFAVCTAGVCNKESEYTESDLLQMETFLNSAWLILRRRHSVRELRKAKEEAEAANKAKNAFLANVSHELRTPLNGILSMHQLIESMPLGDEQREYLLTAQASGKALLRIISDLLDYSCMESGNMPLSLEPFNCKETVRSAMSMFSDTAARKGLQLQLDIDPNIPKVLAGDEARVRQIIFNLVGNALKFTAQGSVTLCCKLLPGQTEDRCGLEIAVADTGIGIPSDKMELIFDAFTQVRNEHKGKYPGTGLGLSIVKHLTAMMGGAATATSTLGTGTTVRCTLFFGIPAITSLEAAEETEEIPIAPLDILIAEDDPTSRFALRAFLERDGHRVVCVEDGRQALESLYLHPFDCLFTDIEMPHIDGLELVRRVRKGEFCQPSSAVHKAIQDAFGNDFAMQSPASSRVLPIIAVTAHTMLGDKERFLRHGVNHYISKPIIKEELASAIRYAARKRRQG